MKMVLALFVSVISIFSVSAQNLREKIVGAWQWQSADETHTLIVTEKSYALAQYKREGGAFVSTRGGSWRADGSEIILTEEFNTADKSAIGENQSKKISVPGQKMSVDISGKKQQWSRLDAGEPGKLAGAWLITGRMNDGSMQEIKPGARRTMKILSGTRFQWIAYNTETKEFFGTGGGTYTTKDGRYTENIDFFSRDNSRVGQSLGFDFALEDGDWRHKGLSSKGDPIDEVWTKREVLGM